MRFSGAILFMYCGGGLRKKGFYIRSDAGANLEQVAALLGHTSLETTRIYTTPTEQDLVKAVEKLES